MSVPMHAFIAALPKCELHLHIEGTLEPELKFELARRNSIGLAHQTVEEMRAAYDFDDLASFLACYYEGMTVQAVNLTTGKETIHRSDRTWLSDMLPVSKNGQQGVAPYDENKGGWFISNTFVDAPK